MFSSLMHFVANKGITLSAQRQSLAARRSKVTTSVTNDKGDIGISDRCLMTHGLYGIVRVQQTGRICRA